MKPGTVFLMGFTILLMISLHMKTGQVEKLRSTLSKVSQENTNLLLDLQDLEAESMVLQDVFHAVFGRDYKPGNLRTTTVRVTNYNPVKKQCDETPLIASDGRKVMPGTVAIPKDYRLKVGIDLGQRITIKGLGAFTVRDHMSRRFGDQARVDIISFIPNWKINELREINWVVSD